MNVGEIRGCADDSYSLGISVMSFQVSSTVDKNCVEKILHGCDSFISFFL